MFYRAFITVAVFALVGAMLLTTTPATQAENNENVAEIKMTGNDQMQYDINEFTVKAGQTVRLTLENIGKLPKAAMGHNTVVLKKGVDMVQFAIAANQAPPQYIPESKKDQIIAHTKLLGPGEKDTIEFTAPEPGTYDYLCTFPGHFAVMKGKMIVGASD